MSAAKNSDKKSGPGAGADEETKRKFREALARKHSHGGRDVSDGGGHAKAQGAHGPEGSGSQQMFRRKAGG